MKGPPVHPPSAAVLAIYELTGDPVRLPGGQERSWRVGDAVLKPLDLAPDAMAWQTDLPTRLSERPDLRVSAPLRAGAGQLVVV